MFCYVILHYQDLGLTQACVRELRNRFPASPVAVVDNGSPNGSGSALLALYKPDNMVKVILNKNNLGFAKGNNAGFSFAKDEFHPNYIVVMNNDVFIRDSGFESKISTFMRDERVDVCGPDIFSASGKHQNPLELRALSDAELTRAYLKAKLKTLLLKLPFFSRRALTKRKEYSAFNPYWNGTDQFNCILQGACVVYGEKFIENEDFAFLPVTFMYGEEAILFDYLCFKGYKTGVCSLTQVCHMEGGATSTTQANQTKRLVFRFINSSNSLKAQIELRKKYATK